jgi:predicted alpha-1,2-mannosidase
MKGGVIVLLALCFNSVELSNNIVCKAITQQSNNSGYSSTMRDTNKSESKFEVRDLIKYVDENIGIDVGKCSFGVSLPFGSIRPCPRTADTRSFQSSTGYNPEEKISGFTNINTGSVYKYVKLLISPQTGLSCFGNEQNKFTDHDSKKANEICRPDYYSVELTRYGIKTEITSAQYSSIYRLTYPETKDGEASMVIYPSSALWGNANYSTVKYDIKNNIITGALEINDGWYFAHGIIYYAIEFSKPVLKYGTFNNIKKEIYNDADTISGDGVGCFLKFNTTSNEKVYLKVAISTKSIENATKFLKNEITGWDFDLVKADAAKLWNKALSTILIDDNTISDDQKTMFYTALYHSFISPKNRTGDCPWNYSGPYYDDKLCVLDMFRSEFPLLTLIKESVVRDNVNSFIEQYRHFGYASDAFLCGLGDMVQGGDDVDIVVADAFTKGVKGINWIDAYKLLKSHATISGRTPYYRDNDRGWVPINTLPKMAYASVSKTLEFAYNDFCASEVAGGLGFTNDKNRFLNRSANWITLWAPNSSSKGFSGFIMAKDTNGSPDIIDPSDDPDGSFSKYFYEGNSWQYSYFVPHQMSKLIQLMGGDSTFVKRLDYYVANELTLDNEPVFLIPFLFNYASRPDLTSKYVRYVSTTKYSRSNYPGDEDSGAMSSWFIFSKLGFFPVAGQDVYLIYGPNYKKVTVQMENGKKIVIYGNNASMENKYVKTITLNGKKLKQDWFRHNDIQNGAVFNFNMSPEPTKWGYDGTLPPSY